MQLERDRFILKGNEPVALVRLQQDCFDRGSFIIDKVVDATKHKWCCKLLCQYLHGRSDFPYPNCIVIKNSAFVLVFLSRLRISSMPSTTFMSLRTLRSL